MSLAIFQPTTEQYAAGVTERAVRELFTLARSRMWRRGTLMTSWRLQRRFRLRFVRLSELTMKVPRGLAPDCDNCTNLCCTGDNAVVSLRLVDIARLLDQGRADRMVFVERAPMKKALARKRSWAKAEADDSVFASVFPTLLRDATGTCSLLTEQRTCGVYPGWPLSCARYPYALDLQLRVIFYAKGCQSTQILPVHQAPAKMQQLARAVVDAYNERVRDVVVLAFCQPELAALGLIAHVRLEHFGRARVRP